MVKSLHHNPETQSISYRCQGSQRGISIANIITIAKHILQKFASSSPIAIHDYENSFLKAYRLVSTRTDIDLREARVLIIGCGYNYPDVLLWSASAEEAVGVDVTKAFYRTGLSSLTKELSQDNTSIAEAYARAFLRRAQYRGYFNHIRHLSGSNEREDRQDLIAYDGQNLPFSDNAFDLTCSNAVLEHVSDLESLSAEIARVTRTGGVCYHLWHNYYSFSGAHVPHDISHARPWGHLTGDSRVDNWLIISKTYLNKKLPSEIQKALSNHFEEVGLYSLDGRHEAKGIDPDFEYEAEHLLTADLERNLVEYPRDVLLTRAYSFLGVKRDGLLNGSY